ncbi:MAG: hypothetical protein ACF8OB_13665, partial [Phycisphaeraceae bacterium JB051]
IQELKGKHTILLSSHILPEVEKTADRVIIIAGGQIKADGSPSDLRQRVGLGASVLVQVKASAESVQKAFLAIDGVQTVDVEQQGDWAKAVVKPKPGTELREQLGQTLLSNGWAIREMRNETASLEQFFIQITADQSQVAEDSVA